MKIKYQICDEIDGKTVFTDKVIECASSMLEANLSIALQEAYDGKYTVEDDGMDEEAPRTTDERLQELEEALALLLSGVTE